MFLKTEPSKTLTSDRNCMQSAIQIEVNKSNFTCTKCADKERHFETQSKKSLPQDVDFRMKLHYLLVVVVVSDISDVKVMSSTVAVISAVH